MSKNSATYIVIGILTKIEKIEFQVITEDRTVSGIISNFIRKYVSRDQFISDIRFVFLHEPFVRNILKCFPDKDLVKTSKTLYYTGMRDTISFIHGRTDVKSVVGVKLRFSTSNFTSKVIRVCMKAESGDVRKRYDIVVEKEKNKLLNVCKLSDPIRCSIVH